MVSIAMVSKYFISFSPNPQFPYLSEGQRFALPGCRGRLPNSHLLLKTFVRVPSFLYIKIFSNVGSSHSSRRSLKETRPTYQEAGGENISKCELK